MSQVAEDVLVETVEKIVQTRDLVIYNDDVNTFDWVIKALVEICKHTDIQAEQCAIFIHTKGKYAVKSGSYESLRPMKNAISERGISVVIE